MSTGQINSSSKTEYDPDGDPEQGISMSVLKVQLAMESKSWDEMVTRVIKYLEDTKHERVNARQKKKKELEELERKKQEEIQRQEQEKVLRQATGNQQVKASSTLKRETTKKVEETQKKTSANMKNQSALQGHQDAHGIMYKQTYDKSLSQGDEKFGQEKLLELFDGLTDVRVYTPEDQEFIACSFKSQLKEIRSAIKSIELLETKSKFENKKQSMEKYKHGLIYDLCSKGKIQIDALEENCVKVAATSLSLIFFLKMQADIYRYMAEHTQKYTDKPPYEKVLPLTYLKDKREEYNDPTLTLEDLTKKDDFQLKIAYKEEAWKHYKKARFISKQLSDKIAYSDKNQKNQIDSIQLGLALNYAVFLWEIVRTNDMKKYALRHLKRVIQRALDDFDQWDPKESTKISQQVELIQENINQWVAEGQNTDSEEEN